MNPKIPESLHLPSVYERVADSVHDGLVIICGVTGSGKSSTLASIINHINHKSAYNIVTIEDPVEYVFVPAKSVISQREVGLDVLDFATGLRGAVRQDPDVIVIGEMRDKETLLAGMMAAETGHLVFVTLHTANVVQSFTNLVSPRNRCSIMFGNGLRGDAQRSCPLREASGLHRDRGVAQPSDGRLIREGEEEDPRGNRRPGRGMHSFTDAFTD